MLVRRDDVGVLLLVVLGEAVCGGLGGRRLEVVQVAVLLLVVGEALAHVVQDALRKLLRRGRGHVLLDPLGVERRFVHADQPDGGEVVGKGAEVALGVRVQPLVEQLGDDGALGL